MNKQQKKQRNGPESDLEKQYNKIIEDLKNLEKNRKELNKKIKSLDCYKDYINKKKSLEISNVYLDMKNAFNTMDIYPDVVERKQINSEIKELKNKLYDLEDQLEEFEN